MYLGSLEYWELWLVSEGGYKHSKASLDIWQSVKKWFGSCLKASSIRLERDSHRKLKKEIKISRSTGKDKEIVQMLWDRQLINNICIMGQI